MQVLTSYDPDKHFVIAPELQVLDNPVRGLSVDSHFSKQTAFARFDWPDWPDSLRADLAREVNSFCQTHLELQPVAEGTPEWQVAFDDSSPDPTSAAIIGEKFLGHFGNRVQWVKSERNSRGRITAWCMVEDLVQIPPPHSTMLLIAQESLKYRSERFPWVRLKLSWKNSVAVPPGPLSEADRKLLQACIQEVAGWASSRIQPVLDKLQDRLTALYGDRFRGLYVFGSYARPGAGVELPQDSDLDVALVLSHFESAYKEIDRFSQITADLSLEHDLVISLIPVREADFREGQTNFTRAISEYAIPVK